MPRTDAELTDALKAAKGWLKEARERKYASKAALDRMERLEGENAEHFKNRKARNKERYERRDEVVEHLTKKIKALEAKVEDREQPDSNGIGFATFDGKTVAAWMVPWLTKSRAAGWKGVVVSGVRTPEYSEQLCRNMCGQPSCPGRCAGRASNHNMTAGQGFPYGALDVSDYNNFEAIQLRLGSPLRNNLPIDAVHFSVSGR